MGGLPRRPPAGGWRDRGGIPRSDVPPGLRDRDGLPAGHHDRGVLLRSGSVPGRRGALGGGLRRVLHPPPVPIDRGRRPPRPDLRHDVRGRSRHQQPHREAAPPGQRGPVAGTAHRGPLRPRSGARGRTEAEPAAGIAARHTATAFGGDAVVLLRDPSGELRVSGRERPRGPARRRGDRGGPLGRRARPAGRQGHGNLRGRPGGLRADRDRRIRPRRARAAVRGPGPGRMPSSGVSWRRSSGR